MRGRRLLVAVAAVLLAAAALPGTAVTAGAGLRATSGDKVTFTVGMTQDVDSLNPFTGIAVGVVRDLPDAVRDADRLRGQGLLAPRRPWRRAGTPRRTGSPGPTTSGPALKWSDGQPLTAKDVAYTFNRVMQRQVRADQLRQLRRRPSPRSWRPTTRTVVMKVEEADARSCCTSTSTSCRSTSGRTSTRRRSRASPTSPGRTASSAPARIVVTEHKKGQFIRLEANPNYYRRQAQGRRGRLPGLPEPGLARPGAASGARSTSPTASTANVFNSLEERRRHQDVPGRPTPASTRSRSTPAPRSTTARRSATATRRSRTSKLRQSRSSYAIDNKTLRRPGARRARHAGQQRHPAAVQEAALRPGRDGVHVRPGRRPSQLLDAAGYTKGSGRHPHDARRQPASCRSGSSAGSSSPDQQADRGVRRRLAQGHRHRRRSRRSSREDALTEIIGQGKFDMFEWGWVVEPDPNYQLSTFTCANRSYKDGGEHLRQPVRLVLLQQGVRRAVRRSRPSRSTPASAPRPSSRCRRWSTTTRRTS